MARFLVALFAATVLAAGQLRHAAPSTAEVFWRAMLPDSPLPDAILRLLRPDTNFLSKAEANRAAQPNYPYIYQEYKRSPFIYNGYKGSGKRHGTTAGARQFLYDYKAPSKLLGNSGATDKAGPFLYNYKAPSKSHAGSGESDAASTARASGAATTTVFFHEEAVRVGERLPFYFPPTAPAALGFLPRRVADSIPFSTPSLPGVLALFGIAPDSVVAASMEETLRTCESPTLAGEAKFCATSLEALMELAMAALGTRDVSALTSTLPLAGAPLQSYTVTAVRPVEGASFLACHDEVYPYTVYRCHTTGPARAYMVEMEGARGGSVTVATVCHTDTSRWNPEHVSFKLLGTKPGGSPVCHLMPYGHLIWAKNVKRSPA